MSGGVRTGKVESLLVDIDSDNRPGSHSFRYAHRQQTDRSCTHDEDVHIGSALAFVGDGVDCDGKGFHHSSIDKVNRVGKLVHQVGGSWVSVVDKRDSQLVVSLEGAVKRWVRCKSHVLTNLLSALS